MKKLLFAAAGLLLFTALAGFGWKQTEEKTAPAQQIEWLTFEEALKRNEKEPRKIIIDVYTDWCGWCKKMDRNTFGNAEVIKTVSEKFYAVKFDAEQKGEIVFKGQTFKFVEQGKRGYHELAAALMNNKMSYPTIVYLDEKFDMIQPVPGYYKPEEIHPVLTFFGEGKYKSEKWDTFMSSYTSPF